MEFRPVENQNNAIPRDVMERVERIFEYHQATKHTYESVRTIVPRAELSGQPAVVRQFPDLPKIPLPTGLLDLSVASMALMRDGINALPESHVQPPQDLKTLATWLYMAYGITGEKKFGIYKYRLRACPSASALFPCEIYVVAMSIRDLEPGLYSFNPREFCLTKLRDGNDALTQLKRGRPELAFLKSVPAALLVSTNYWRTAWKYRSRGYRVALQDAGHLISNLVTTANGLGIQTMCRLQMNDSTMRELIGIPPDADFTDFEAVQAMVVWADAAASSLDGTEPARLPPPRKLPPIPRTPLSDLRESYDLITNVHFDCMKPGVPIREIRPPHTELSPVAADHPMRALHITETLPSGPSIRQILLKRRSCRDFTSQSIARNKFLEINRSAFRSGTFVPLYPDGPHMALVRPLWMIHDVSGITAGVWYYHPPADRWSLLRGGDFRQLSAFMCMEQKRAGNASALCVMMVNLHSLLNNAGPDLYRLSHLEAGIVGQRLTLAAGACGVSSCGICSFYDDEIRTVFGMQQTGWEPIYAMALGYPDPEAESMMHPSLGIG